MGAHRTEADKHLIIRLRKQGNRPREIAALHPHLGNENSIGQFLCVHKKLTGSYYPPIKRKTKYGPEVIKRWYYMWTVENLTQQQIGVKEGVHPVIISLRLTQAIEEGIINYEQI